MQTSPGAFSSPSAARASRRGQFLSRCNFTRNAYAAYQSFVDWLAAAGTVILCYNPTGDQEYRRDVDVNFLQKGELNEVGWLEVPSSFYVKTPWYKPYATTLSLETAGGDSSKRYDYVYDSSLMYGVDSSGSLAGELRGGGHIPGHWN